MVNVYQEGGGKEYRWKHDLLTTLSQSLVGGNQFKCRGPRLPGGEGGRISGNTTYYSLYVRVLKAEINSIIVGFWLVFVYAASPKNKLKSIQMSW